jgi:hypothetical protein
LQLLFARVQAQDSPSLRQPHHKQHLHFEIFPP